MFFCLFLTFSGQSAVARRWCSGRSRLRDSDSQGPRIVPRGNPLFLVLRTSSRYTHISTSSLHISECTHTPCHADCSCAPCVSCHVTGHSSIRFFLCHSLSRVRFYPVGLAGSARVTADTPMCKYVYGRPRAEPQNAHQLHLSLVVLTHFVSCCIPLQDARYRHLRIVHR